MPKFLPFKALIPQNSPEKVSAPPYDVLSLQDCRDIAARNPNSFVRIARPELELPDSINPYSDEVYTKALANFREIKRNTPYIPDNAPCHYVYRLQMGDHVQFGIAALASTDDYRADRIKKHEKTRKDKEDDRTRHIMTTRSHSGPVLLTYKDDKRIDEIVAMTVAREKPFIDFTAENGVKNSLWRAKNTELEELFGLIDSFYIADGHHRAASAARVADEINKNGRKEGGHNLFLAVAFPASQMKILPYNRLMLDFNGKKVEDLILFIEKNFGPVRKGTTTPSKSGEICLITDKTSLAFSADKFKLRSNRPEKNLDVAILQDEVLKPFFGIDDPRTDKRIDFVGGIKGVSYLEKAVKNKKAVAAFSMFPVSVVEIMAISDSNGIMPPKSTWFEPKLRDGLLLDEF